MVELFVCSVLHIILGYCGASMVNKIFTDRLSCDWANEFFERFTLSLAIIMPISIFGIILMIFLGSLYQFIFIGIIDLVFVIGNYLYKKLSIMKEKEDGTD